MREDLKKKNVDWSDSDSNSDTERSSQRSFTEGEERSVYHLTNLRPPGVVS